MAQGGVGIRRSEKRERGLSVSADINVTSLVDVAFTLLVIFIITAPILQGGVEVRLPQDDVQPTEVPQDDLPVTIRADGTIVIQGVELDVDEFEARFPGIVSDTGAGRLVIRADRDSRLEVGLRVVAAAAELGVRTSWARSQ